MINSGEKQRIDLEDISIEATQTTMEVLVSQLSGLFSVCKNCQTCKRRCNQQCLLVDETDDSD